MQSKIINQTRLLINKIDKYLLAPTPKKYYDIFYKLQSLENKIYKKPELFKNDLILDFFAISASFKKLENKIN